MVECNFFEDNSTETSNLDNQQFRLSKLNEIKDYFIAEIKERELMSKILSKYISSFDYFDKSLTVLLATSGSISIVSFATVIGTPVGIANEYLVANLADMQLLSKFNKSFRILLYVIDICSKYAWVVLLKNKRGASIVNAFQSILKKCNRKPNRIWVDKGSEFYHNFFKKWLQDNDIEMYSTYNEGKSVVAGLLEL